MNTIDLKRSRKVMTSGEGTHHSAVDVSAIKGVEQSPPG